MKRISSYNLPSSLRMRKSLSISAFLLRFSTITNRHLSSSSSSLLPPKPETLFSSSDPLISQEPTSNSNEFPPMDNPKTSNLQILTSQNHQNSTILSEAHVVSVLLSLKHQPACALKYIKWAEKQPGFTGGVESFCVLFHILVGAGSKHRKSAAKLVSSEPCPGATILIQGLLESAKRFGFCVNTPTFQSLLDGFATAHRMDDALICFNVMIDNFSAELKVPFANRFLQLLIKRKKIDTVKDLVNKMSSIGIKGNIEIFDKMMESCVAKGNIEEAKELIRKAKDMGSELKAYSGSCAFESVSKKHDSDAICELLKEMIEQGLVPSGSSFMNVVKVCAQQRKMEQAIRFKDEMISYGTPMTATLAATLIKGFCELGDLDSALSLFASTIKCGLSPNRSMFLVLINECCKKGDMEKACELHNLRTEMGFKPSFYLTYLLLKGLLDAQLCEKACEHLAMAVESGSIKTFSFNFLMSWLCADGKVDEARELWDKIVETGSIPSVSFDNYCHYSKKKNLASLDAIACKAFKPSAVVYTTLMDGYFMKGEVEKALKVFDEMGSQAIDHKPYTYNSIIRGLCYNGHTAQARELLEEFSEGANFEASLATYCFIIDGFIKEGDTDSASSVSSEMSKKGVSGDVMLKRDLVRTLCKKKTPDYALEMVRKKQKEGFELDVTAYEALIDVFSKNRRLNNSWKLYSDLLNAGLPPTQQILDCMITAFRSIEEDGLPRSSCSFEEKENDGALDSETQAA